MKTEEPIYATTFFVGKDTGKSGENSMLFSVENGQLSILVDDDFYNVELSSEETRTLVDRLAGALGLSTFEIQIRVISAGVWVNWQKCADEDAPHCVGSNIKRLARKGKR